MTVDQVIQRKVWMEKSWVTSKSKLSQVIQAMNSLWMKLSLKKRKLIKR